jgi:hypothetical protein
MIRTIKHGLLPLVIVLVACGQGEPTQAAAPAVSENRMIAPASVAGESPAADMQMAQMDHSMHGANHNMDMPKRGTLQPAVSKNGLFKGTVTSELDPVVINQLHSWTLQLTTADGKPVEDASITVAGSMPAHAHGMPTQPQVTANLGGGSYKVEGMQFQMGGEWEVTFSITSGSSSDSLVFHLTLQ